MKTYFLKLFIITFFSFSFVNVQAQKDFLKLANQAYDGGQYTAAVELFREAYNKTKKKAVKAAINFKVAECFRLSNDIKQSEIWYSRAIESGYRENIVLLRYAQALQSNEKYTAALEQFNVYLAAKTNDPLGEIGKKSCEFAIKLKETPTSHVINNMAGINSQYSDFSPAFYKNGIVFTSARENVTGDASYKWTGEKFTDLFITTPDQTGKWDVPQLFKGGINTPSNEGTASFSNDYKTLYFTRCLEEKGKDGICNIYVSNLGGVMGDTWSESKIFAFSSDTSIIAHPSLSTDGKKLFFTSNIPGGFGGKDIYVTYYDEATQIWDEPANLGPVINTSGDEMFPSFHSDGKTLHFSSNGHLGMGGMDNFFSTYDGIEWRPVQNLGYPLNSGSDDFGLILDSTKLNGYFSSTREGGKGNDDIYSFYLAASSFALIGNIIDDSSKAPISEAKITVSGSDTSVVSIKSEINGTYYVGLKPNTSYTINVSKDNYFGVSGTATTVGLKTSADTIVRDFYLKPMPKKGVEIVLPNILYDLAKWDLRPESKVALDGLVQILKDNSNIIIAINSHTDCRSSKKYNVDLSQKRAQSVVDYLVESSIEKDRLVAKGYGEDKLLNDCACEGSYMKRKCSEEEHQLNRRTAFEVLSIDYVPKPTGTVNDSN